MHFVFSSAFCEIPFRFCYPCSQWLRSNGEISRTLTWKAYPSCCGHDNEHLTLCTAFFFGEKHFAENHWNRGGGTGPLGTIETAVLRARTTCSRSHSSIFKLRPMFLRTYLPATIQLELYGREQQEQSCCMRVSGPAAEVTPAQPHGTWARMSRAGQWQQQDVSTAQRALSDSQITRHIQGWAGKSK